ncbi:MAG TPA: response regulator transcription factor [Candidatus Binatia bacterium]|nr:response regulator transcription factor [Candidatus Binatia bacterium]
MSTYRILLADDHPLFLVGIRRALEAAGGFEVVGEAYDGSEVLPLVGRTEPDVVLLDLRMPGMDGIECLERLRARHPAVRVLMLANEADPAQIEAAFVRGARGFVVKTIDPEELAPSIHDALASEEPRAYGLAVLNDAVVAATAGLSERELEILRTVSRGLSNKAIARELWISEQTVKFHLTNIYRKLGISNRTEAARWALGRGIHSETSF